MNDLSAAEVLHLQTFMRSTIASARFYNHCANETNDAQFKQLCQQFTQDAQSELQRLMPLLQTATPSPLQ